MVHGEQSLRADQTKAVLRDDALQTIASVALKVLRNFVLGLEKGHFEHEMSTRFEHPIQFRHYLFRVLDMLEHGDAKYGIKVIVNYRNDVERGVNLDVGTVITGPGDVLIYELSIDEVRYLPAARAGV